MRVVTRSSPLAWALASFFVAIAAPAERNSFESEVATPIVGAVDPWAEHGGSKPALADSSFSVEETLDPWRARAPTSWMRVGSGLESNTAPSIAEPHRAPTIAPRVGSGLDVAAPSRGVAPASWIHPEIVDPWATRSNAQR